MTMTDEMTYEECPPDPYATQVALSQGGYSFVQAVADVIDNSITAHANNLWLELGITQDNNPIVYIWDDGYGMDASELGNAMKYGSGGSSGLGRFGMGLKSASTSISRSLDVFSRKGPEETLLRANWDMDRVQRDAAWNVGQGPANDEYRRLFERHIGASGTLITWEKIYGLGVPGTFNNNKKGQQIRRLKEHLSLVFHKFIESGSINIHIGDEPIEPWSPFPTDEPDCTTELDTRIQVEDGDAESEIRLVCHILPDRHTWSSGDERKRFKSDKAGTRHQGFYVYRENRIISAGGWLGVQSMEPHANLCRFELHLPRELDNYLEVNYQKTKVEPDDELVEAITHLSNPVRIMGITKARQANRRRGDDESSPDHAASSRVISERYNSVSNSQIESIDDSSARVTTKSDRIVIRGATRHDDILVNHVSQLDFMALWKPTCSNNRVGVEINTQHDFYQRVYRPLAEIPIATKGLDMIFWSLANICFGENFDLSHHQMEDMQIEISRKLQGLARELPEPEE